jgi:hypothetical protein
LHIFLFMVPLLLWKIPFGYFTYDNLLMECGNSYNDPRVLWVSSILKLFKSSWKKQLIHFQNFQVNL